MNRDDLVSVIETLGDFVPVVVRPAKRNVAARIFAGGCLDKGENALTVSNDGRGGDNDRVRWPR